MKKSINRNIAAADYFVNLLEKFGVSDVCISPGSRSTPLTIAFASNNNFSTHINVDERASCFFALGLAKQSGKPVVVVTTSGTAAAELTPAIVEAYFARIPLIICTADRPGYLAERGANQVINQRHMFSNHTRGFYDTGLPMATVRWFNRFSKNVIKKLSSLNSDPGPVHFNFPFEKPFEPSSITDEVDMEFLGAFYNEEYDIEPYHKIVREVITLQKKLVDKVSNSEKILMSVGPMKIDAGIADALTEFANEFNCAVAVDSLSLNNFMNHPFVVKNFSGLVLSPEFITEFDPDLIIHFGAARTSDSMLNFMQNSSAYKISVNAYGDKVDPARNVDMFVKVSPIKFCGDLINQASASESDEKQKWVSSLLDMGERLEQLKNDLILKKRFPFEGRIIHEMFSLLPDESNLFLSNSLPVRDFNSFISTGRKVNLYHNRGASGIDGIISTAAGVAQNSDSPTTLIIGDLAFYHDLNSLYLCKQLNKPFVIILINNNGGAIFEMLPIAEEKLEFDKYFKTPLDIDFSKAATLFDIDYSEVKSWAELKSEYINALDSNSPTVLEIKTNSQHSLELRRIFWKESRSTVNKRIDEIKA
jgi:2-succinyl-5-enolpyruvyl-6-hydroxy-3-cyclohexene-1-carboxylate synthase